MTDTDWNAFCDTYRDEGYTEFVAKPWAADLRLDTHEHAFDVQARVVQGEMWLESEGQVQHLSAGDRFSLSAHAPHRERYGAEGTLVWIARRPV